MIGRNERGVVLPTRLLALSISAVAASALVYIVNDPDRPNPDRATPAVTRPSETSSTPSAPAATEAPPKPKVINRGKTLVEIFNNTRIKGLAGRTASTAQAAGWNVVGTDNWYGTIPGTSVYYPPKYADAARALSRDLGIRKVRPAEDPMRLDRITVILTDDYSG